MPAKEIKELRVAGRLNEALALAKHEYEEAMQKVSPDDENDPLNELRLLGNNAIMIWPKRNLSWVYYEYLKKNNTSEQFDLFQADLINIKNLELPTEEKILFDQVSWQVGKMGFALLKENPVDTDKFSALFELVNSFRFTISSEGYSFLFKAFHKAFKDTDKYIPFADWWNLKSFRPEDYQQETMPNGKEVMALAEQAYIAYAKHLLPATNEYGEYFFDRQKAETFLPLLDALVDNYPQMQYPAYFKAKLLLALGDRDNMLSALLPFAKKKKNDFWVWEILSEVFSADPEKVLACHCKALSCTSPEEMLVKTRQKMAATFIQKQLFDEAKTEIEIFVKARNRNGWRISNEVTNWQNQDWYKNATVKSSNFDFYRQYTTIADALLFSDVPEETIIIDFVNSDKKMLNFIASESKFGFFKYDRFLPNVKIGETLKVRFNGNGAENGNYQIFTLEKTDGHVLKQRFLKEVEGKVEIGEGKSFGFVNHIFVHPSVIKRFNVKNNQEIKAIAINSFQVEKKQWSWKVFDILENN
ncbi:hypothetical protein ABIB62_000636 [Mucilaginibacter sp. UYP25]|uniref:DUF7017 domain-containing protein n=1 Tax=unclassified Mucilaginibacter TaxID=2617802 RepID=UPI003398AC78